MNEQLLKNQIKKQMDKYEKIDNLIFTTFEFENTFFENQLIPFLFEIPVYKNISEKALFIADDFQRKITDKESKFYGLNLSVYYDHFVGDVQGYLNYQTKKVNVPYGGIFHPKLIIFTGKIPKKKKYTLSVIIMSANLTINSYGRNYEVVAMIEKQIDNSVRNVLNIANKEKNLDNIFEVINKNIQEIFITGRINKNKEYNDLQDKLDNATKIQVITPFIDEEIIKKYKDKVELILTTKTSISSNVKDELEKFSNEKFSLIGKINERKIHAKIYVLTYKNNRQEAFVGSHNFTSAAIEGKNVEASYLINDSDKIGEIVRYFNKLKTNGTEKIDENNDENMENNLNNKSQFEIVNAQIDWDNMKFFIELNDDIGKFSLNKISKVKLVQIGNEIIDDSIKLELNDNKIEYDFLNNPKLSKLLYMSNYFKIKIFLKLDEIDYEEEIDGIFFGIGKIPEKETLTNVDNYFELLEYIISEKKFSHPHFVDSSNEEDDENDALNFDEASFENSVKHISDKEIFEFYKKLNNDLDKIQDKQECIKFFKTSSLSVFNIIDVFKKYVNQKIIEADIDEIIYFLLTINEQRLLIKKYNNRLYEKFEDEELERLFNEIKEKIIGQNWFNNGQDEYTDEKKGEILDIFLDKLNNTEQYLNNIMNKRGEKKDG